MGDSAGKYSLHENGPPYEQLHGQCECEQGDGEGRITGLVGVATATATAGGEQANW